MAILKSIVDVNNGNTGWTKTDVVDALETVFANLGWNNGTAASGVPCMVKAPGFITNDYSEGTEYQWNTGSNARVANWEHAGGQYPSSQSWKYRYFNVSNNGTSAYRMLEEWQIDGTQVDDAANSVGVARHGIQTGDALHYAAGVSTPDANLVIGGLSADTIYYAIRVDDDNFKVAANATDAGNGVAIDISPATTTGYYFQRADDAAYDNYTINLKYGDKIVFNSTGASGAGGTFNLVYNNDSYDAAKLIESLSSFQNTPSGQGTTNLEWDTRGYRQTEDEALRFNRWVGEGAGTSTGDEGIIKYIYANDTNASMKGEIVLEACISTNAISVWNPYWKYTVPANGGRSELKLRIYRGNQWYHQSYIIAVTIDSIGSGWTDGDSFTIPGTAIGGASPANDLVFGTNTDETSSNAYDGIASIGVTNLGAGSNFWQKHPQGYYAVARVEHDAAKTFGTTYYGIGFDPSNDYKLCITSGSNFDYFNRAGINYIDTSSDTSHFGVYEGEPGLDYSSYEYIRRNCNDSDFRLFEYASNATPTAYPLQIRVYRAQAPQDTDFAIIQFAQVINGIVQTYATFTLAKGSSFGAGTYDLDYVFQDALTQITTPVARAIDFTYGDTGYEYYKDYREPGFVGSKCRAASYGYLRDRDDPNSVRTYTRFACNIDTNNSAVDHVVTYYRNSAYDQYDGKSIDANADYYKPIKGLPISNKLLPIPYYLPDDFVMLQVATTPGLVAFRTGDTITVSGSEIYEIITASYESQQNGLDQVNNNSTIGMLFMARTT